MTACIEKTHCSFVTHKFNRKRAWALSRSNKNAQYCTGALPGGLGRATATIVRKLWSPVREKSSFVWGYTGVNVCKYINLLLTKAFPVLENFALYQVNRGDIHGHLRSKFGHLSGAPVVGNDSSGGGTGAGGTCPSPHFSPRSVFYLIP